MVDGIDLDSDVWREDVMHLGRVNCLRNSIFVVCSKDACRPFQRYFVCKRKMCCSSIRNSCFLRSDDSVALAQRMKRPTALDAQNNFINYMISFP